MRLTGRRSFCAQIGASLLLSEISNATGDPQLHAVADVLRVQIAQSAHFNVMFMRLALWAER